MDERRDPVHEAPGELEAGRGKAHHTHAGDDLRRRAGAIVTAGDKVTGPEARGERARQHPRLDLGAPRVGPHMLDDDRDAHASNPVVARQGAGAPSARATTSMLGPRSNQPPTR